jgi:hypothetical protein
MTLSFPNPSRTYDPVRRRICFWGYDRAMEVPFFLEESVLFRLDPQTKNAEAAKLATYDAARDRIHAVADKVHSRHIAGDF